MDQEFQIYITKIQCQSQEDLDMARFCFESMISNFEFGPFLLEKCQTKEYHEYINAILVFKAWINAFWNNGLEIEQKQKIIETLFQLIYINKPISSYIFDIFILIVSHDKRMRNFFQDILPPFLENFDLNERLILENLLLFLSKLFTISKSKEFYYSLFKHYFYPIFTELSLLENNEANLFQIFNFSLQCFSTLFFQIETDLNDIIQPIEFCRYSILNCNDTKLVSRCSSFLLQCHINKKIHSLIKPISNEILDLHINNIGRFIQKEDDCVVFSFLRTIHKYGVKPECFEIFLGAALLTHENINDFYSNPFMFYTLFYSASCREGPRGFSLMALDTLLKSNPELIYNLKQLEINELSMRIFGFLSTCSVKINKIFLEIRQSFIETVLPIKFENLIDISSKLYLILKSLDSGLFDDSFLIGLFFEYFDIQNDVIHSLLCKIVCKMNSFVQEIPLKILYFLPSCQNLSALKALNNISKKQPEILFEICEPIISVNKISIEKEFNLFEEEQNNKENKEEDDDIDIDSGRICCNLNILTTFHEQFIQIVHIDEIVWLIDHLLRYDFNEDTLYFAITEFINSIFHECSKHEKDENYFLVSKQIMICILKIFENIDWKSKFINAYGYIFLFPISLNKTMFLSLDASSTLIEFCINILSNEQESILTICDIISFLVQIDQSIDCQTLTQFCLGLLNQENDANPLIFLGLSNILASIIVTGHDFSHIPPSIFLSLKENNFYVRIYDKHLTAAALNAYQDESLKEAADDLNQQEIKQKNMSKNDLDRFMDELNLPISINDSYNDYPFPAPIQL